MRPSADHRSSQRIPFSQKVRVVSAGRMVAYAAAINIGMGGVLLGSTSPLAVGSLCKVAIPIPGGEGVKRIVAEGTVVRGGDGGTAVQFLRAIEPTRFNTLFSEPAKTSQGSLLDAYRAYFQVSRTSDLADCEKLLGVSKRTFRATFYTTFLSCITLAVLPVWLAPHGLLVAPNWLKVTLSFAYGSVWLLVIQPGIDLSVFHILRNRQASPRGN